MGMRNRRGTTPVRSHPAPATEGDLDQLPGTAPIFQYGQGRTSGRESLRWGRGSQRFAKLRGTNG